MSIRLLSTLMAVSDISSSSPAVRLHSINSSIAKTKKLPVLHLIRHAEGYHNIGNDYRNPKNLDAVLTEKGIEQCKELSKKIQKEEIHVDTIISSPMRRALQTAHHSFEHILNCEVQRETVSFLACEHWRETVNYICDVRLEKSQLETSFPLVDFDRIEHECDPIWSYYEEKFGSHEDYQKIRESNDDEHLRQRARKAWQTIAERPTDENSIAVVAHSAIFMHMFTRPELGIVCYEDADVKELMQDGFLNCELRSVAFDIILEG